MKILLGIDTSAHCRATVSSLLEMPWPKGTRVVLVSAIAPAESLYAPEPHVVASAGGAIGLIEEDFVRTHGDMLASMEQQLRDAGFETETRLSPGNPGHLLVDTARSEGADLIVVGCHGHQGFGRRLLGSVASHVVADAPCNVLVIKCDESHPAG
jgi:nucleotide-binding universal stress UspA family protein